MSETIVKETNSTTAPRKRTTRKKEAPAVVQEAVAETKTRTVKEVDLSQYITVRNGFQGRLVYKSKRTGETFVWDSFGAEQDIELLELKAAKNSNKRYFENNWFMFDDDWVIDFLGVNRFYKNAVKIDDFDSIFDMSAEDLADTVSKMSKGQKRSVAYRAKQLISDDSIDSLKVINTLEELLNIQLIER